MKLHSSMEVPFRRLHKLHKTPKIIFLVSFVLILLTVILLCYPLYSLQRSSPPPSSPYVADEEPAKFGGFSKRRCDIFSGEWVPDPKAPYYTNSTCSAIHEYLNCMKNGRPDTEFLKWRWKPDDCELPVFDPAQFLEIVRGKSLAFVGDSVARNHMQSLVCLLSRVEYPIEVSYTKRWNYITYNFTLAMFWTPFLVKSQEIGLDGSNNTDLFNLYLDEFDETWTSQIENFDYVIISAGHWFFRSSIYYQKRRLVGCQFCQKQNITALPISYGYRRALRTSFRAINSLKDYKGTTFLRTFSPTHFENGAWNMGGNCVRQRPFKSNETGFEDIHLELYMVQLAEYKKAEEEGAKRGLKYMLLDTTQAMLLRPDGHPSRYGHRTNENVKVANDCLHWCLPGPIDTWNDFLLEMLKVEKVRRQRG